MLTLGQFAIIAFAFGAIMASFGNCIAYRIPRGMNWINGHSECEFCGKKLQFFELIPIVSCVIQGGRCTKCKGYFGYSHAISEFILGLLCYFTATAEDSVISAVLKVLIVCAGYCITVICVAIRDYKENSER